MTLTVRPAAAAGASPTAPAASKRRGNRAGRSFIHHPLWTEPFPPGMMNRSCPPRSVVAGLQPLGAEHSPDVRSLAVEGAEHRPVIHRVAAREDEVAEALAVRPGHAAMRFEPGEGRMVE